MSLKFSQKERQIGKKIYQKFLNIKLKNLRAPLISFKDLNKNLNIKEKNLINKILSINPKDYGKSKTIFYGFKSLPKNLVAIKKQNYYSFKYKGQRKVSTQYLPLQAYKSFKCLKKAMQKDLGTTINVTSGYRTPAYQALILFIILFENKWDIRKTLKRITLPGCSEHNYPSRQAIDVAPVREIKKLENFDRTLEYKWLIKNAKKYNFYLSYSKGNRSGVMFEPWHWHYQK